MALLCSEKEGAIPSTSNSKSPLPISLLSRIDLNRSANIQASALALHSLDLALPAFSTLDSHTILEARDRLKDQLGPFRAAMCALAPKVRSGIVAKASIDDLHREAVYIVETDILPRLEDLTRRLAVERGTFWRRLIQKVASQLPGIALKWVSGNGPAAAVAAARIAGGVAAQAITNEQLVNQLLSNGGLGYLLHAKAGYI